MKQILLFLLKFGVDKIEKGVLDEDSSTSLFDEIKALLFPLKGSYAKQIQSVLKSQTKWRLGKYSRTSFGEIWAVIKPLSDKISNLGTLKKSIQNTLAKHGCIRVLDFLLNPLRIVLYYKQPKTILFSEVSDYMTSEDCFYPFVLEDKLCKINPEKEVFSHCLISGITGSGKTVLLKNFIASLKGDSQKIFCNPKNDEGFEEIKNLVTEYIVSKIEISSAITEVLIELERRLRAVSKSERKIFLFVDELSLLSKTDKANLTRIANVGRSLGIHLVLATQRPTKETIPTEIRSQLTYTLTGRVTNKQEAYFASGQKDSGAEGLQGSGLFVLNASGYSNVLVQAMLFDKVAYVTDIEQQPTEENEKMVEVYDYTFDNAPKSVLSRKSWIEKLLLEEYSFSTLKELQDNHEQYFGKKLNSKTAKQILEWMETV